MARDVAKEWAMFEALMIATFGDHWHAPAMRHLDIDERALRRWERGERPISLRAWEHITASALIRADDIIVQAKKAHAMWQMALREIRALPSNAVH